MDEEVEAHLTDQLSKLFGRRSVCTQGHFLFSEQYQNKPFNTHNTVD